MRGESLAPVHPARTLFRHFCPRCGYWCVNADRTYECPKCDWDGLMRTTVHDLPDHRMMVKE